MANHPPPVVTDELIVEIARRTQRNERSVYRRLLGLPVRGCAGTAVDRALAEIGLSPTVSVSEDPPR